MGLTLISNVHTRTIGLENGSDRTIWGIRRGKTIVADWAETILPILPIQIRFSTWNRECSHSI